MPEPVYFLTEADRTRMRKALDWIERAQQNIGRATRPEDDPTAPERYIFHSPNGGVPARVDGAPGYAVCAVYLIENRETDEPVLATRGSKECRVFNLTTSSIPEDTYFTASRDKFGSWVADGVGGGRETAFNFCGIADATTGFLTGMRVTWLAEDGLTTTCETIATCPPCEDGEYTGTGTSVDVPGTSDDGGLVVAYVTYEGTPVAGQTVTLSVGGSGVTDSGGYVAISCPNGVYTTATVTQSGGGTDPAEWSFDAVAWTAGYTTDSFLTTDTVYFNLYPPAETGTGSGTTSPPAPPPPP